MKVDPWCDLLTNWAVIRGRGYRQINTLYRGSALYPHYGTHGLALPFGWTNGIPTEPSHCHNTLMDTPTNSPLGSVLGDPAYQRQNYHRHGKQTVPDGDTVP